MGVLLFCLIGLIILVGVVVVLFAVSPVLGVIAGLVGLVLAIPLGMALVAQIDLLSLRSKYKMTAEESEQFARLLPQVASQLEAEGLRGQELKASAKKRTAEMVLAERV